MDVKFKYIRYYIIIKQIGLNLMAKLDEYYTYTINQRPEIKKQKDHKKISIRKLKTSKLTGI